MQQNRRHRSAPRLGPCVAILAPLRQGSLLLLLAIVVFVAGSPAAAEPGGRSHKLSVQAGSWNVEADYVSDIGLQADLGLAWAMFVGWYRDFDEGGWIVPLEAKLGWEFSLRRLDRLKLRVGFRGILAIARGEGACEFCRATHVDFLGLAEIGLRTEFGPGFVVGLEVPVFAFYAARSYEEGGEISGRDVLMPLIFTHIYFGYRWRL